MSLFVDHTSNTRAALDRLFAMDAILSMAFGVGAMIAPHRTISFAAGGAYNHGVHETLRCVRSAKQSFDCISDRIAVVPCFLVLRVWFESSKKP